jgi:predicted metal-binding protein
MKINLQEILDRAGVFQHGIVNPRNVEFVQEVRQMCADNRCNQYGKTWACPPAIGTIDECAARARRYDNMLIFSGKYPMEDSFDFEGMMTAMRNFKEVAQKVDDEVKPFLSDYLILGNEGCGKCETCTYPDNPCRFPEKVHGSIEGYGVFVNKLAEEAGMTYNNGANTVTYFGALLYNNENNIG